MKSLSNMLLEKLVIGNDIKIEKHDIPYRVFEILRCNKGFMKHKDEIISRIEKCINNDDKYNIFADKYFEKYCDEHRIDKKHITFITEQTFTDYCSEMFDTDKHDFEETYEDNKHKVEFMVDDDCIGINAYLRSNSDSIGFVILPDSMVPEDERL